VGGKKINLGDNPTHTAFVVDDYDAALELHKSMNCIDFIHADGMHFLKDPDGYSLEIMSKNFLESISAED
jgi:lactoylglutathione lyase